MLCKLIYKYGGTVIDDMGKYSIEEQIHLFQSHNCVIGVHGNNLTGIMWMKPNSHVFEILPYVSKMHVYDYHCMSLAMKHHYTQINCIGKNHNEIFSLTINEYKYLNDTFHLLKKCIQIIWKSCQIMII